MILHGPENIAGAAGLIAEGQRILGYDAISICHFQPNLTFSADYHYGARGAPNGRAVRDTLMDLLTKADRLHIYFGRSFLGDNLLDARLARLLNKRVFFMFLGCDLRNKKVRLALQTSSDMSIAPAKLSMCSECNPHGCSANRAFATQIATSGKEPVLVSTPDLKDEIANAIYIPLPARSPKDGPSNPTNWSVGPLRVLHAPTDTGKKGTRYVVAAVETLQKQGYPIELVMPDLLDQGELFALAQTCHIAIDQVMAGVYGTFAAEMMMAGLPVIARIDDAYRPQYPDDLSILSAGPSDLVGLLKQVCDGKFDLAKVSAAGMTYALREHSHVEVARRISSLY